ncbi:inositol 1,4,5-trisphosphate receptor-interacting protein [Sphaeramia orbicularis]|uniref:Inositol 1,4,5-trisphosphate receptor-interacting protein n=1 Tax=Sphaeramia orbicularis TaxID=375764 RepID=A0A673CAY6_9TELE|nr:inositol 1,4,5-trisphosphate receptor-interacting protein-like [Sphaeramia orbicularis]
MQDTFLRVFVVALGLLMSPKNDPGLEEWDTITTGEMQTHEERLLREGEKLDQEMASGSQTEMHTDDKGTENAAKNVYDELNDAQIKESDQHVTENDAAPLLEVNVGNDHKLLDEHLIDDVDLPHKSKMYPETSQIDHDDDQMVNRNLQLDTLRNQREDIQSDGHLRDLGTSQWQQESTEAKEVPHQRTKTSENQTSKKALVEEEEKDYLWYIWNTLSVVSLIRFFWKYMGKNSQMRHNKGSPLLVTYSADDVSLPDSNTLQRFHSKCVQVTSTKKEIEAEFLDGFTNDLLEAMRTICEKNCDMTIEDVQIVDAYNICVPLSPPEPYSFKCLPWNSQICDILLNMQICGQIKLVENKTTQISCHCQTAGAEDMVCLLHCDSQKIETEITDAYDGLLCQKNSPFLSKLQVSRWFQSTIIQAWSLISHKYEFELDICKTDAAGSLVVRFRSGKKIHFCMNPVVTFNTDAHYFITPYSPVKLDTFWTLSLISYEDCFLEHISQRLPDNSCHIQVLEIAHFLHKRQTVLSGSSTLKDFHFKIALMHLLLTKDPSVWKAHFVAYRLQDLLAFMGHSLETKQLYHVLIGNPLTQGIIQLPAEFVQGKPVNLFHPLVAHKCIYRNALMHFQEMLRNANMLIHDYVQ